MNNKITVERVQILTLEMFWFFFQRLRIYCIWLIFQTGFNYIGNRKYFLRVMFTNVRYS